MGSIESHRAAERKHSPSRSRCPKNRRKRLKLVAFNGFPRDLTKVMANYRFGVENFTANLTFVNFFDSLENRKISLQGK